MNLTSTITTQSEAAVFVSGLCLRCLESKENGSSKLLYSLCHDRHLRNCLEAILTLHEEERKTLLEFLRIVRLSEEGTA